MIFEKNDLTSGPLDPFWAENLPRCAREVFSPKRVSWTLGKVIFFENLFTPL